MFWCLAAAGHVVILRWAKGAGATACPRHGVWRSQNDPMGRQEGTVSRAGADAGLVCVRVVMGAWCSQTSRPMLPDGTGVRTPP